MGVAALLPDAHGLALFAAATLALNATPGVDLLLATERTLAGGRRAGVAAAAGIGAGCTVHTAAAASGVAALLAVSSQAFTALKIVGAAYLLWLGWGMARDAWRPPERVRGAASAVPSPRRPAPSSPRRSSPRRAEFRRGFVTNVLNPKVALFFLAFLPPFVPAATPSRGAHGTGRMMRGAVPHGLGPRSSGGRRWRMCW